MDAKLKEVALRVCACAVVAAIAALYGWQAALLSFVVFVLGSASALVSEQQRRVRRPRRSRALGRESKAGLERGFEREGRRRDMRK